MLSKFLSSVKYMIFILCFFVSIRITLDDKKAAAFTSSSIKIELQSAYAKKVKKKHRHKNDRHRNHEGRDDDRHDDDDDDHDDDDHDDDVPPTIDEMNPFMMGIIALLIIGFASGVIFVIKRKLKKQK